MPDIEPRRSVLYVPADKPRALLKARSLAADAVIVDLEDSVAAECKAEAREALRECLTERLAATLVIRVNGLETEWRRRTSLPPSRSAPMRSSSRRSRGRERS